ncbi:hypothetical protein DFH08DRAFT_161511 [Mycena albidolilacea]|uniref:Cullin N-terminal domain-containing protein n=1 Tax=Mycena albidolilacea TaxID=1033008 RepID=A0AAD7A1B0_9AGAR|nr:hypothetical protein DFH08DRAFT_161511 [Mycena albidolilacea]
MASKLVTSNGKAGQDVWTNDVEPTTLQALAGSKPVSMKARTTAYTAVWNYIMTKNAAGLYAQSQTFFAEYTMRVATAAPSDDSALPEYYDAEWDRFVPGVKLANRILDLIHKRYVKREPSECHGDILTVRNLAFKSWKKNVLVGLLPRIDTVDKARLERVWGLFAAPELDEETLGDMRLSAS